MCAICEERVVAFFWGGCGKLNGVVWMLDGGIVLAVAGGAGRRKDSLYGEWMRGPFRSFQVCSGASLGVAGGRKFPMQWANRGTGRCESVKKALTYSGRWRVSRVPD